MYLIETFDCISNLIVRFNALLYGTASKELSRLQSIQNKAAKLIFSASKFDSPAPLLDSLHWLPIRQRIFFKLCIYVYKAINSQAPQYLSDIIKIKGMPSQGPITRSSKDPTHLVIPSTNKCIGDKSFAVAGPSLWNTIPRHVRESTNIDIFKQGLKTFLYPQ